MFYNPETKRTVISERAEFDKHSFPGLCLTRPIIPPTPLLSLVNLSIQPEGVSPNKNAKRYAQHPGIDYNEVFAPIFRPALL